MKNKNVSLPEALKEHYGSKELSESQIDKLNRLQQEQTDLILEKKKKPNIFELSSLFKTKRSAAIAASVLIALMLLPLQRLFVNYQHSNTVDLIVAEVAYNHNKRMKMEIYSTGLPEINTYLEKLDFNLINSGVVSSKLYSIVGARYCSIQGQLAAQLKIKDKETGEMFTFYQSKRPDGFTLEKLYEKRSTGALVKVWLEGDLLLSLAGQ